jgi:predicted DNA-binding transcriptional regulator AlpA
MTNKPTRYLSIRHLRDRYAVSDMTIWRRIRDGTFPPPDFYDRRFRKWAEATLDAHDAEQVARTSDRKAQAKAKSERALARRADP